MGIRIVSAEGVRAAGNDLEVGRPEAPGSRPGKKAESIEPPFRQAPGAAGRRPLSAPSQPSARRSGRHWPWRTSENDRTRARGLHKHRPRGRKRRLGPARRPGTIAPWARGVGAPSGSRRCAAEESCFVVRPEMRRHLLYTALARRRQTKIPLLLWGDSRNTIQRGSGPGGRIGGSCRQGPQRHDAVRRRDQWRRCSKMPLRILFGKTLQKLEEISRPKLSDGRNTHEPRPAPRLPLSHEKSLK